MITDLKLFKQNTEKFNFWQVSTDVMVFMSYG